MISTIKNKIFSILQKAVGGSLVVFPKGKRPPLVAVRSDLGFWYAGNIFNRSDIAYGILRNGYVEKEETDLVLDILKALPANFALYDIGANTGYYGIMAGTLFPQSTVHSFEPVKDHITTLKENISINNLSQRVTLHEIALGEMNATTKIHLAGSGSTLTPEFSDAQSSQTETIEVKTLDSVMEGMSIISSAPHFIKIDVEGYELSALKGAEKTIKTHLPILFVEIAYTLKNLGRSFVNDKFKETIDYITSFGYIAYKLTGDQLKKFDSSETPDGVHMYLFLHKEKHKNLLK